MTFEEFKEIAVRELPQIEAMIPKMNEIGASRIRVVVDSDGYIDFSITAGNAYDAYHTKSDDIGEATAFEYDTSGDKYKAVNKDTIDYYQDDGVEDDLPYT